MKMVNLSFCISQHEKQYTDVCCIFYNISQVTLQERSNLIIGSSKIKDQRVISSKMLLQKYHDVDEISEIFSQTPKTL